MSPKQANKARKILDTLLGPPGASGRRARTTRVATEPRQLRSSRRVQRTATRQWPTKCNPNLDKRQRLALTGYSLSLIFIACFPLSRLLTSLRLNNRLETFPRTL